MLNPNLASIFFHQPQFFLYSHLFYKEFYKDIVTSVTEKKLTVSDGVKWIPDLGSAVNFI